MDTNSTEVSIRENAELMSKSKRKRARKRANRKQRQRKVDQMLRNLEIPGNEEIPIEDLTTLKNSDLGVQPTAELLPLAHVEIEVELAKSPLEKNVVGKRKRRRKKRSVMKAMNNNGDTFSMAQKNVLSNPSLLDNKHGEVENALLNSNILDNKHGEIESGLCNPNISMHHSVSSERKATGALCFADGKLSLSVPPSDSVNGQEGSELLNGDNIALSLDVLDVSTDKFPAELSEEGLVSTREVNIVAQEKKIDSCAEKARREDLKVENDTNEEVSLFDTGRISAESCSGSTQLSQNSELTMHVHSAVVSPGDLRLAGGPRSRRKLLILDVNGLLADIVTPPPKDCNPDACFSRRAIFKRPFCNDFLNFCFERFDVGIWSSRSERIIVKVVNYLLGKRKRKLLFCWDISHSTQTSFRTLDNKFKPLVCKDLSKVWDRYDPSLPWERGDYDESNTLLLDDSPYKALLNPAHTAIFPVSYNFKVENDNSLGPGGDLRVYLEELSKAEHVQKYVEQHPFGQRAIDETSSDWNFYSDVLCSLHGLSGQDS